jgi:hypothetical protein
MRDRPIYRRSHSPAAILIRDGREILLKGDPHAADHPQPGVNRLGHQVMDLKYQSASGNLLFDIISGG